MPTKAQTVTLDIFYELDDGEDDAPARIARAAIRGHVTEQVREHLQCTLGNIVEFPAPRVPTRRPGTCRKFRFTHDKLMALPPHPRKYRAKQTEYRDTEVTGLCLEVGMTGRKHFAFRCNFRGRKRYLPLGEFPSVSLRVARDNAHRARAKLTQGIDPTKEHRERHTIPTVRAFSEDYLEWARHNKRSWRDDAQRMHKEILPRFGDYLLDTVTRSDVQKMHDEIRARTSGSTANRYLALLRKMYAMAIEWQIYEGNPARAVKLAPPGPPRDRYLSRDEIVRFLGALERVGNRTSAAALRFLLFSGLRKGEVLKLEWRNVRLGQGAVYLPETKSGKPRTALLNGLAKGVLEAQWAKRRDDNPFVFPGRSGKKPAAELRPAFDAACAAAGIEGACIHTLRHTFASICVSAGASLYDVQHLLGHASSQMTQRYAHLEGDSIRRASEMFAAAIAPEAVTDAWSPRDVSV